MDNKTQESQLIEVLGYLLEATNDKEQNVREATSKALHSLIKKYPQDVVENIILYREKNGKISENSILLILNVLETAAQEKMQLPDEVVTNLVQFSFKEMQRNDSIPAAQSVSSDILIHIFPNHFKQVLEYVFLYLKPEYELNACFLTTLGRLASSDAKRFVPVAKIALSILVPMMPPCRNEQIRIALSFAVGKFSEAILEYVGYLSKPDDSLSKETFSEEITAAYNVIANSWIQAKEIKVCESAINSLGPIFTLLPEGKANQATSRAIICLLNAYKRPCIPHYLITQCLATVLKAATPQAIQPVLDQTLHSLGNMVVVPPDFTLPPTVKQNNEVLRCYDHLGEHFPERLGDLLIKHLRMGNERDKIEALIVCSHLILGSNEVLGQRVNEITSAIRGVLQDPSLKVKKALVKVIIALSCKGYAQNGSDFVEFLVRHCAVLPTQIGLEHNELANVCSSTIQLLSSTVENMQDLLWNCLLKLVTDSTYDHAVPVITKALTQIAPKRDPKYCEGEPSRELVLCRCFALLGSPLNSNRGPAILCFLQQFSPFISVHIADLWTYKLPQLINYLQVSEWSESEWDSLLLEMINNTVTTISCHDGQWPLSMSKHLAELLTINHLNDEANVILSTLAINTAVIEDKAIVAEHLDIILSKFKTNQVSMKECARAIGILSSAHLDMVLTKLDTIAQTELNRRNSRLWNLMKDSKAEAETEKCREALLECYAAIANRCPLMEFLPKLDQLTQWIMIQITSAKEQAGRDAALEAILNCAESLVRHKTETKHSIKNRANILDTVLQLVQQNKPNPLAIKVITVLVKLPPHLVPDSRQHIMKTCFDRILSQESPANGFGNAVCLQTLKQLGELVEELLLDSVTPDRLDEITTLLEPWIKHRNSTQRLSALTVLRTALLAYYHNMQPGFVTPSTFNQSGDIIGTLVVRYFDSEESVCKVAAHCIGIVLAISNVYDGHSHDPKIERMFENLPEENTSWHLTKILCNKLPHPQLHKLTGRLLDGLTDVDVTACSNASDVLAAVFTLKGAELFHYINDILGSLILQLVSSGGHPTNGVRAVLALAKHHPKLVINVLLKQPLPLHESLTDCWKAIATDDNLKSFALDHILVILSTCELFDDDSKQNNRPKTAAFHPLAAVSGLSEMVASTFIKSILSENISVLIPALLTLLAAFIGSAPPVLSPSPTKSIQIITNRDAYKIVPSKVVKDCLQRILLEVDCKTGAESLTTTSQLQHIESLVGCMPQFTLGICQNFHHLLPKLLMTFNQYSTTSCENQRIIITAFYAECFSVQCSLGGSVDLIDNLISNLLSAITAPDQIVRALALKGLGYISSLNEHLRKRHEDAVLSALMQGVDDIDGSVHIRIPLEAIQSLSKLIPVLDSSALIKIQVPVAIRIKPFFEKEELGLRSTSLKLFGQLCIQGEEYSQDGYKDQALSCFTHLLLHVSELEPSVVKACKFSLRQIAHLLNSEKVKNLLLNHLIDDAVLQFEPFAAKLVQSMSCEMEEVGSTMFSVSLSFTKSKWPTIRANAALLLGLLYKNMSNNVKAIISPEPAIARLIQVMKDDQNADVRAKAIKSLPLFLL
ncbi:maestro heat-like repeat-containing protein family member 1 isoform X2 [Cimex lectularius]|uniref:Maestro heat-like repeat-containing protein family member 1 n=1 Tax=Cimex lectularius TaxID=79782 RepID=A0A8I6RSU1_CIMLE|nr:maestro heat-like repeat-containing protein family member 1 isoform X2 [Cimex lectularius]